MKLWVTLPDREAEVEFHADGERLWVELEGRRVEADFRRLPDGEVYSLLIGGRSHEVRVSSADPGLEISLEGVTIPVEVRHPLEKLIQSAEQIHRPARGETIKAPMPGTVVALRVKPGDRVAAGQAVAVVEAMKMQNELAAAHGGVVSQVLVAEKESVAAGQPLVRLEPER